MGDFISEIRFTSSPPSFDPSLGPQLAIGQISLSLGEEIGTFSKGSVTIKRIKNDLKLAVMFLNLGLLFMKVALGTVRLPVNPGREQSK